MTYAEFRQDAFAAISEVIMGLVASIGRPIVPH